ncbi:alpha/beta-hydrolase [Aspergillus sclerotiicarbonarius CBS 121057]|uniref:Alpha/beta-hydrolase n=1 Tax=Aspergillus sclerotiicarbonarius (strain CBS 121057 / IBT 28362) TaxID=1448318 RepID=A0A319EQL7_ASPSB|nr:alpha/beta-hydrolase [Aspergillus sclerotiicarbonarius CBS 121057]
MYEHPWSSLSEQLGPVLPEFNRVVKEDPQYLAFTDTSHMPTPVSFAIKSVGNDDAIFFTFNQVTGHARIGTHTDAVFTLVALPSQWQNLFQRNPVMPYQSYWALYGQNIRQDGVEVLGDQLAFANYAHIWRTMLDLLHDVYCGPNDVSYQPEQDEDFITGRYIFVPTKAWGRCKIFYEASGTGPQGILFLHTAGSDSRQYHGVMNDPRMRHRCTMYAFDLPSHGRSFPSPVYPAGGHTNSEDAYLDCIAKVIKTLGLKKIILCGASMAGQACIAAAIRADEVGIMGSIPLQGCERVEMYREWYDKSPLINSATFNPEWVYGMMCPMAPAENRRLLWHTYSAQAYGVYHGDLDFYFNGWDGRGRVEGIDTTRCPIFFLTGEYDWSNTPEMSEETARKIPGARFKRMPALGHFPATENPGLFVGHLLEAIEHILGSLKCGE